MAFMILCSQKNINVRKINTQRNICTIKPVFKGHLNIPEKVSLHDRCPFITGFLTCERYNTILRKHPQITGCHLIGMFLEDRSYCINK